MTAYSPTGWTAVFTRSDGRTERRPVYRFAADGKPMIVYDRGPSPKLKAADEAARYGGHLRSFDGLVPAPQVHSAIPAAPGWRVRIDLGDDEEPLIRPIAAWVVHQDGTLKPVAGSNDFELEPDDDTTILAPDDPDDIAGADLVQR